MKKQPVRKSALIILLCCLITALSICSFIITS